MFTSPRRGCSIHLARRQRPQIHPSRLSERILANRRRAGELVAVNVYRGRPVPDYQEAMAAINDAQTAAWERDPRVNVVRRA